MHVTESVIIKATAVQHVWHRLLLFWVLQLATTVGTEKKIWNVYNREMWYLRWVLLSKICLIIKVSSALYSHLLETSLACCFDTQLLLYIELSRHNYHQHILLIFVANFFRSDSMYNSGWVSLWQARDISNKWGDRAAEIFIMRQISESRTRSKCAISHYSFCSSQIRYAVTN